MKPTFKLDNWRRILTKAGHALVGTVDGEPVQTEALIRFEPDINQAESWPALYTLGTHAKAKDSE